jgi:DNA-directed RNA polymerase specialized sigma subunit
MSARAFVTEGALVLQHVARGEADAVRECIRRFGPLVWAMARRFFGRGAEAEDASFNRDDAFYRRLKAYGIQ